MPLNEYTRKRKFNATPGPTADAAVPAADIPRFYIQRHDASRLHYDLRLEVDGVLKSWAVPKGPTLDPSQKRLAVMVEDHPLAYGTFEGNIPAGNYGAGSVLLWDTGTFTLKGDTSAAEQLARGDFKFFLEGQKLRGEFALVKTKQAGNPNGWLLLKKRDAFSSPEWDIAQFDWSVASHRDQGQVALELAPIPGAVASPMPAELPPMLACPATSVPTTGDWLYEVKWDGVRALVFLESGGCRITGRRGRPYQSQYPEITREVCPLKVDSAIIDGEIAVLDERGRPNFQMIQPRIMASGKTAIERLAESRPAVFFAFDLLYYNGFDLRSCAIEDRKRLLESLLVAGPHLKFSAHFANQGERLLAAAREQELEGVIAKRAGSPYESKRSNLWLKLKVFHQQSFVIAGFSKGNRAGLRALILAVYENEKLVHAGSVGTGFDDALVTKLLQRLRAMAVAECPMVRPPADVKQVTWVRPELVCLVRYFSWTDEEKLRGPVFLGLQLDADPREAVREETSDAAPPVPIMLTDQDNNKTIEEQGRTLKLTNLNKMFYPADGHTKRDLLNYYDQVADLAIPHLKDRPLSLKRYPDGIDHEFFFQKHINAHFPEWIPRYDDHGETLFVCNDRATLLYLTNLGCIDQNPWMSRVGSLDSPDFILVDLDSQEASFDVVVQAALAVKRFLDQIGLRGYPKTTGGDGLHIYLPIEAGYSYEQARMVAEILARLTAEQNPELFTTPRSVAKREKGKVYFDYLQISRGKTISAPYVVRAYAGAPVATPLDWSEVRRGLTPQQFTMPNAMDRFRGRPDRFAPVLEQPQRIEGALAKLAELLSDSTKTS